ncbi:MAG: hypothetical protein GY749_20305 [Desulfobacteraceae bacterium]|nr:hypothetical protein [Desulfobacteraceae bacterium]
MKIWLKEKIGSPELFTGRKQELSYFLDWIDRIKQEISQSTALLSRRKTGKSALLQRLYNITFHKNDVVIPFYYEIKETDQWIGDFSTEFFLTFVYQYIAFKTRNREYLIYSKDNIDRALKTAQKEKLKWLINLIEDVQVSIKNRSFDYLWETVRDAPRMLVQFNDERMVQFIDEFQFINRCIFRDQACKDRISNLAGSYLHTCEYKNAPLLVSGSWVGWLMDDLSKMLPGRFVRYPMLNLPEEESIEMIYKYSLIEKIPVSEETVYLIANLTEGNPFYISALFRSRYPEKDLTSSEGVRKTLEFETLNIDANINTTWMEYIDSAFSRINDVYAKDIVMYLAKNRHRFVSRKELKQKLNLSMTDTELEKKFRALYKSDIIEEHYGRYRGVQDNIFDKVFTRSYSDDVDKYVTEEAPNEYKALFEKMQKKYQVRSGEYSRYKGAFAEFMIWHHLKNNAFHNSDFFKSMLNNLPDDFSFAEYDRILSYHSPPLHEPEFQIDVFARAKDTDYSLIGEVKNRKAKFSIKEAHAFLEKAGELIKLEKISKTVLFVFSVSGFHKNTFALLKKHKIAWTDDRRWLKDNIIVCSEQTLKKNSEK